IANAELKNPPPGFDSPFGLGGASYFHIRDAADKWDWGNNHHQLFNLSGAQWARQDFWWGIVEPEQGKFEWEFPDKVVDQYRKYGINLFPIICYGSAWQKSEAPTTDAERKLAARYTYLLVSRYRNTVHAWEIWNEPNILPFWSPKPNPADYAALLKECYTAAKNANPNCIIVGGALAGVDESFLRGMYQNGVKGYFDALSYHTYGQNPPEHNIQTEIKMIRKIMGEFGDDKPIWMTETGYYTGPAGISEDQQAKWIVRSHLVWLSEGVDKIIELTMLDWTDDPNTADGTSFRGIVHASFAPKPAFYAYRTMTEELAGKKFFGKLGLASDIYAYIFAESKDMRSFQTPLSRNSAIPRKLSGDDVIPAKAGTIPDPCESRDTHRTLRAGLPKAVLVLWADDGKEKLVTFDPGANTVLVRKLNGDRELVKVDNNHQIQVKVTDAPIYIEGVGEKVLFQSQLVKLDDSCRQLTYLSDNTVQLHLYNPLDTTICGIVGAKFALPETIKQAQQAAPLPPTMTVAIELAPKERKSINLFIPKEETAYLGIADLVIEWRAKDTNIGTITLYEKLEIVNPIKLRFLPIQSALPAEFSVQLENYSGKEISGTLSVALIKPFQHSWELPVKLAVQTTGTFMFDYDITMIKPLVPHQLVATFTGSGYSATTEKTYSFILVPKLTQPIKIDGELSDWSSSIIKPQNLKVEFFNQNSYTGQGDIEATGYLAWSDGKLYLAIDVTDDKIVLPSSPTVWDQDSLQIAIDGSNDAEPGHGFDNNDFEFELALMQDNKTYIAAGQYPAGRIDSIVLEKVQLAIKKKDNGKGLIYELMIPEEVVTPLKFENGKMFGFNFILNDNDTGLRKGWLELAPGIGWGKEPAQYKDVILVE
ncbi:MAG: sugar-binding protein, partial [bacterium]|nr:sugar-binding protein [bacterium]